VQPLVRYVVGDLVQVSNVRSRWTPVPALESVEGKLQDAVIRPDGALVTPGAIDRALTSVALRGYQVTHRTATSVDVDVVGGRPVDVSDALSELFAGMQLTVREGTAVAVETNGKVRTSRGLTPPQLATLFAGCTSGEHG
jgi:phenylacetate-coenzyme A ligase PaaK-like adenylate-forming protein